jgi:isopentenyl-diphosphate delta-isomerase
MTDIGQRKRDHIGIVLSGAANHHRPAGFDDITFVHNALPEIDCDAIDLGTEFLGHSLRLPYLASSMTGGPAISEKINSAIAEAAEELGFAIAVGSQRIALTTKDAHGIDASLRKRAPSVPIFANLGAVQFVHGMGVDDAKRAVEMIGANALILHLNPLQEALQDGGDRNWRGVRQAIEKIAKSLPVPIIAKEVGSGISVRTAKSLIASGVAAIDMAGAGGTSWAAVEGHRGSDDRAQSLGDIFRDWGIPTARGIADLRNSYPDLPLIASGGIRHGLDGAKAIRLGADLVGQAAALLAPATQGTEAVIAHVKAWAEALRIACFATGSKDLGALKSAEIEASR